MPPQPLYFCRRAGDFPVEPPAHLRKTLRCDICQWEVWVNKDNWENLPNKLNTRIVCSVCYAQGRHITG